jgi:hypothetical protein
MSSNVDDRETFRRVSDALEILQLDIDTHLRDLHNHRAFSFSPPPQKSPSAESSIEYQLKHQQTKEDAAKSRDSTPDLFELPIMQFESPPASLDRDREPGPNLSGPSERELFEKPPLELDMTSVRAFLNPVAPNPVIEAYEPESFEVPIMLDIASVQAFSNPLLPGSANESAELLQPASYEASIVLDVASVQDSSNPVSSNPNPVAERFEFPHPDTSEIPQMGLGCSPALSSNIPAYDFIFESFALPSPNKFEVQAALDESFDVITSNPAVPDSEPPSPISDTSYLELVTRYFELAVRHSTFSTYHSETGARHSAIAAHESIIAAQQSSFAAYHSSISRRQSNIASHHFNIAIEYSNLAAEYCQLKTEYSDLAVHHPDSSILPEPMTLPSLATPPPDISIYSPEPLVTHLSSLAHPGNGTPHLVASGPTTHWLDFPRLVTSPSYANNISPVSNSHFAATCTLQQPSLPEPTKNVTSGDEHTSSNQGSIPYSPKHIVQTWLQHQQVLAGIPVDQVQSMTIPGDRNGHQTAPWITLTEEGALARGLPPIRMDAISNSTVSNSAASSNPLADYAPLTGTFSALGSGLTVVPHTAPTADLNTAVSSNTPNTHSTPISSTPATYAPDSSSLIGLYPTGILGSPVVPNPTTVPSSPAGTVPVLYQLVMVAPEEIATSSTPTRSAAQSERGSTHHQSSDHMVGNPNVDPWLKRVKSLPRSSSSSSALSSSSVLPNSSVIASWNLPFRPAQLVDSSPSSDSRSGLELTWSSPHASEGRYQDPRATIFLTPLATFVATQSSPLAPSVLSPGHLSVVNRDESDLITFDEEIGISSLLPGQELDSPQFLYESSSEEGVNNSNSGHTNGVSVSVQHRFPIDGADDSPDKPSDEKQEEEKGKEPAVSMVGKSQTQPSRRTARESWVYQKAPMCPLTTAKWEDEESAGSGSHESTELSPQVFWPDPHNKEDNVALVMEQEALRAGPRDEEDRTEAEQAKDDHPWNYD